MRAPRRSGRRRPGKPARHEVADGHADIRHWPLITANGLVAIALAAGTALALWGAFHVDPPVFADHGRRILDNDGGRDDAIAGLWILGITFGAWAAGMIGYSLCLYGKKLPLEIEVGEMHGDVVEVFAAVADVKRVMEEGGGAEKVAERRARHRRDRLRVVR